MRYVKYYGYARNKRGKLEQLIVHRWQMDSGELVTKRQQWTNKVYGSVREANRDMVSLNCVG